MPDVILQREGIGSGRVGLRPLRSLRNPAVTGMLGYWRGKRGERSMPSPDDIDPVEFARYLPNLQLIQVDHDPLDFSYRLLGECVAEAFGGNRKGFRVRDLDSLRPGFGSMVFELFSAIVAQRRPFGVAGVTPSLEGKDVQFESVHMPLSFDGERVDRILCASSYRTLSLRETLAVAG